MRVAQSEGSNGSRGPLRVLALEPYLGGSHQAFLEGWIQHSRHDWTVVSLPARHWKWRMRHAAVTMARQVAGRSSDQQAGRSNGGAELPWQLVFCSDMLNLAEFRGLAPPAVAQLPAVAYFHENQWTYPDPNGGERDRHYGFTNLTTALAAEQAWFNSAFNRDELLTAADAHLRRMPDHRERQMVETIRRKSRIMPPGVAPLPPRPPVPAPGALRITWAARWELDKEPATLFDALRILAARGVDFRVSVLGESFRNVPGEFTEARGWLGDRVAQWGFLSSRQAYADVLRSTDVFVSTARHEFFGLAVVEAILAGAYPLLPRRVVYPELLGLDQAPERAIHFYDGRAESLAAALERLAEAVRCSPRRLQPDPALRERMRRFEWSERAPALDKGLEALVDSMVDSSVEAPAAVEGGRDEP